MREVVLVLLFIGAIVAAIVLGLYGLADGIVTVIKYFKDGGVSDAELTWAAVRIVGRSVIVLGYFIIGLIPFAVVKFLWKRKPVNRRLEIEKKIRKDNLNG